MYAFTVHKKKKFMLTVYEIVFYNLNHISLLQIYLKICVLRQLKYMIWLQLKYIYLQKNTKCFPFYQAAEKYIKNK